MLRQQVKKYRSDNQFEKDIKIMNERGWVAKNTSYVPAMPLGCLQRIVMVCTLGLVFGVFFRPKRSIVVTYEVMQ